MASIYRIITAKEVNGLIRDALELDTGMEWINRITLFSPSASAREKYGWLGQVPSMKEWIGNRVLKQLREYDYEIKNNLYDASLEISIDDLRRDKTGQLNMRIADFANTPEDHWVELLSDLIDLGASAQSYDSTEFFSASHEIGDSGTMTNLLTSSDYDEFDVTDPEAPTSAEMSDAILVMLAHFKTMKDDQGRGINKTATQYIIMVQTVKMWKAAAQAITKDLLASGSTLIDNPLKNMGFNISVVQNTELNSSTYEKSIIAFRADGVRPPLIRQQETPPILQTLDESSDFYKTHRALAWFLESWRNVGFGFFQSAIKATFN